MQNVALTKESYAKLLQAERNLTGIVGELDKAEKCNIDCQGYRSALKAQLEAISNMKLYFAPKQ